MIVSENEPIREFSVTPAVVSGPISCRFPLQHDNCVFGPCSPAAEAPGPNNIPDMELREEWLDDGFPR